MTLCDLRHPQKAAAVKLLCTAFHDYPVMRFIIGECDVEYDEKLEELIGFFVEGRLARDVPLIGLNEGKDLLGIAVVSPPVESPEPQKFREYYSGVERRLGAHAMERMCRYNEACESTDPGYVAHYLGMIGIRPDEQGRGLGRQLMDAVKEKARTHPESTGIVLNTETESNLSFYEKVGFRQAGETDVGSLHTWSFFWSCI
jgi:GNAT superfamily N-acetyltransferase